NQLSCCRSRRCFAQFLDETGDSVAGLRAFADPILRAIHLERKIVALFEGIVSADFLNEFAVARAAAVGEDDAECRRVFRADAFHANFYRHKFIKRAWKISFGRIFASLVLMENASLQSASI